MLDRGEVLAIGTPKHVVSRYQKMLYAVGDMADAIRERYLKEMSDQVSATSVVDDVGYVKASQACTREVESDLSDAYFDPGLQSQSMLRFVHRGARIEDPHLETLGGHRVNVIRAGAEYIYTYLASFDRIVTQVRFGMLIKSVSGLELGGAISSLAADALEVVHPGLAIRVKFRFRCMLAPGTYFMNAGIRGHLDEGETFLDRVIDAILFRVLPDSARLATGYVDFHVQPQLEILDKSDQETH
jgi:lipopolysaccharide transport system ATP-binding protein